MAPPGKNLEEWRRGWGVVLCAALGVAIVGIYVHFIGAMIRPLQEAYGWSRGEIAFGLTLISVLSPIINMCVGFIADRVGARRVALAGILLFGVLFSAMGLAGPALWTWYAVCVLFGLFGHCASAVVWTMVVVKRFHYQRGLALALSLCGGGFMVAVTPLLVVALEEWVGVRGIFFTIGICGALIMLVPTLIFFHERDPRAPVISVEQAAAAPVVPGFTLKQALRMRQLWQLAGGLLLISLCMGTFVVHIQPMLTDSGLTPAVAASVALFIGPSMIVGRLATGALFDIFDPRLVTAIAFLLPAVACGLLMFLDGGYLLAAIAGIFVGLGMGAEVDVVAYLTSRYFGLRNYGTIFAVMLSIYGVGTGVGSAVAGFFYDLTASYDSLLLLLVGFAITAAALATTLGRPARMG